MIVKTMGKCTGETQPRSPGRKKVRSLLVPGFLKKRQPSEGVGMAPGSGQANRKQTSEGTVVSKTGNKRDTLATLCRKMQFSSSALFDKKSAVEFIKSRVMGAKNSRTRMVRKAKAKARARTRRACISLKKTRMLKIAAEKKAKGRAGNEDPDESELCKKRILMGRKCKPLTASGSLKYDENGILLPEKLASD